MKDDYLWDKTGEPDSEIEQLEQVLGVLRYRPHPLEIPAELKIDRKRSLLSSFAIAAAIVTTILAVGLWTALNRRSAESRVGSTAARTTTAPTDSNPERIISPEVNGGNDQVVRSAVNEMNATQQTASQSHRPRVSGLPRRITRHNTRGPARPVESPELTPSERLEAEAAKEQLMLALRLASSKLSLAQKKAQGTYPANLIRNQHKVG